MAAIGMMIGGAVVNALAFTGSNYLFSTLAARKNARDTISLWKNSSTIAILGTKRAFRG